MVGIGCLFLFTAKFVSSCQHIKISPSDFGTAIIGDAQCVRPVVFSMIPSSSNSFSFCDNLSCRSGFPKLFYERTTKTISKTHRTTSA